MMNQHIVFYDGTCGMCHWAVGFLLKSDKKKIFLFAPLQGETAAELLKDWRLSSPDADSLVLLENYHDQNHQSIATFGKGFFRILWLLGGWWKMPGSIFFLPSFLYDWGYKWIARRRFRWFKRETCPIPQTQDLKRFLP